MRYISFIQQIFFERLLWATTFPDVWDPSLRKTDKGSRLSGTDTVVRPQPTAHYEVVRAGEGKGGREGWTLGRQQRGEGELPF